MRRSGIKIMLGLIQLVQPLMGWMLLAIILGVLGFLCAIFLSPLAIQVLLSFIQGDSILPVFYASSFLVIFAILRGFLRYGEQACNHYIAFRLLAVIRHQVFVKLRELAPAKLSGRNKGDLVAMITSDIELLEVFYAHTISPVAIGLFTSLILVLIQGHYHPILGVFSLLGYGVVGILLPLHFSKMGKENGLQVRQGMAELNSSFLDTLRGVRELIQFEQGTMRLNELMRQSRKVEEHQQELKEVEGKNRAETDVTVMAFFVLMSFINLTLVSYGQLSFSKGLMSCVLFFSSFGPVIALSSLSNNLHHTLASGQRVLDLLKEEAIVKEISGNEEITFDNTEVQHVSFAYQEEAILKDCSLKIHQGKITGILGKSGSGKSTLIRLLMRFYQPNQGKILIHDQDLEKINTTNLRNMEAFVSQDTILFNDTIFENIAFAKEGVTQEEVEEACKKASLHDWVMSLPKGYKTKAGELGESLSGGERQRISLARAFLANRALLLLDEPTSNLDSLNEAIILKSLKRESKDKTIVLVSHQPSTLAIADEIISMKSHRSS